MKKIDDTARLSNYIDTYDLQSYMDNDLLEMATLHSFEKEEHLIRTGTPSEYLYFLVEGTVMVYSFSSDTQTICIDYAKPAAPLGEALFMGTLAEKQCQSRFCLRLRLHPFESLPQHLATRRPLFANHLSVAQFPLEFGDQLSEFIDGTCRDTVGQIYSCASRKPTLFLSVNHLCRNLECQLSPPAANLYQLS